jgi:hypothetical protein
MPLVQFIFAPSLKNPSLAALGIDLFQGLSPLPNIRDIRLSVMVAVLMLPAPTLKFSVSKWTTGLSASNTAVRSILLSTFR